MSETLGPPASNAFAFDNTFVAEMEGFYSPVQAEPASAPQLLRFNAALADELGLDAAALNSPAGAQIFAGNVTPSGAQPVALAYAGHQFGGFSPQLGDGRALLLGELFDRQGRRVDLQLKGTGRTPFSRRGDGRAALGPVLREYLMGEAMHALGIPTTRALAAVSTGDPVFRETTLPGAVLARVAASHIRVGSFQFFAARGENKRVQQLADYVIVRHYPQLVNEAQPYLALLTTIRDQQAALIAQWMLVGFIHGVMNTDNMTVSGQTIDYGPCAFMDYYDPATVFSSIDYHGRYAYRNQPVIGQWNLARLAETMLPLLDADSDKAIEVGTAIIEGFMPVYEEHWLAGMRAKLGLRGAQDDDRTLIQDWLDLLQAQRVDFTLACRYLADVVRGDSAPLAGLCADFSALESWLTRWQQRLGAGNEAAIAVAMDRINPLFIPRNHLVEAALASAVNAGDYGPFDKLMDVTSAPFTDRDGFDIYRQPAPPSGAPYQTFCGT